MKRFFRVKKLYFSLTILAIIIGSMLIIESSISSKEKKLQIGGESKTIDFGSDIGKKKVFAQFSGNKAKLYVKKNFYSYCYISLSGFEQSAVIKQVSSGKNQMELIEVTGFVGAHSENRQYFYLDTNMCPKPIAFEKNGQLSYNVYSDEPNFILRAWNKDEILVLIAEFRNWDANPISDTIRDAYHLESENQKFIFVGSENFSYSNFLPDGNN